MTQVQRFLVKMPVVAPNASLSLAGQAAVLRARPLFGSITESRTASVVAPSIWHIVEAPVALDMGNPWDVCHSMVTQGLGLAGGVRPEFAEPDLQQPWISAPPNDREQALVASCAADGQKTGPDGFPGAPDNFWYQDDAHGQFARALADLPLPADVAKLVRVAHLDTGYDPDHRSLPLRLERPLQRNFVDDDRPNDAADESSGFFNNLGHGTGTLSILAGAPAAGLPRLGAAPFVKVVPIRVANRVELFYNSAIAQAFDYVHGLTAGKGPESAVAVISMSMGGLASRAWADAVNALYEAGVVVVTAAGNNFGNLPTRNIVYPARFNRVIAACGVMADHSPYADLALRKMAGNYGPDSKMRTALAASTPNVPWAKFGCADVVDFDGAGTSAATPQIAAAAAMWLQKNKVACDAYSQPWMRVEAARRALFSSAVRGDGHKLGNGELQVAAAMAVAPAVETQLVKETPDSASFGFLKVLTGLGVEAFSAPQQAMLELEALQLSQSAAIEAILPDAGVDPASLDASTRSALAKALAEHPRASQALRRALRAVEAPPAGPAVASSSVEALQLRHAVAPRPPEPTARRLRIYAYDPSLGRELETISLNETISAIRWERDLAPGPVGEYIEVVDVDPASGCCYAPVDLNDPRLLASDGLRPAEANPQFHQQMAYAVAMKTIEHFERALGRTALWSPRVVQVPLQAPAGDPPTSGSQTRPRQRFVQRLRIYPHALREQNAYYSPDRKALLLGYFSSRFNVVGAPSQTVFTALSHDIVAHETTHALLDGLHQRFREPTNPDVLAFHEAFADIVALFQHFTLHESLRDQLRKVRGDLSGQNSLLAQLAVEFGRARGLHGGLRNAIGQITDDGAGGKTWTPARPTIGDYQASDEPHARGAVLVAAVFDAFSQVYARRALRPISLATGGSEVLPPGALSSELADALTDVAAKVAGHVLTICIRALDYCPPVDITFGDFLRALVTADHDLVPSDPWGYRVAFVSAFARRGIFPEAVRSLSVETVLWEPPPLAFSRLGGLLHRLRLQWDRSTNRRRAWLSSLVNARQVHRWLRDSVSDEELDMLGLQRRVSKSYRLSNAAGENIECDLHAIEVHSVRPLQRVGPDGRLLSQLVVELTQSLTACDGSRMKFRGGATILFDLNTQSAVYMIRKRFDQVARVTRSQAAWQAQMDAGNNYTGLAAQAREPFAFLHRR